MIGVACFHQSKCRKNSMALIKAATVRDCRGLSKWMFSCWMSLSECADGQEWGRSLPKSPSTGTHTKSFQFCSSVPEIKVSSWFAIFIGKTQDFLTIPTRPCQSALCSPPQVLLLPRQPQDKGSGTSLSFFFFLSLFLLPLNTFSIQPQRICKFCFFCFDYSYSSFVLTFSSSGHSSTSLPVFFLVFPVSSKALITVTFTYISRFICLMPVFSTKLQAAEWQGLCQSS